MRRIFPTLVATAMFVFMMAAIGTPAYALTPGSPSNGEQLLAAGIAFGLAALGAGVGVGTSGSAAIAAVTEKAEVRTTALIFVVLAEAIAIYGFAIAFIIIGQNA